MLHEYSRLSFKLFCQGASCVISKKSWNYHPMQQQIDTTCQTPYIWATSMSYPTACKMWQNTRIHTHTRMRASVDETSITGTTRVSQETSTGGEGYYFGGPKKTRENSHIVFYVALLQRHILHFYSAPPQKAKQHKEHCTFTALCNASHCASLD